MKRQSGFAMIVVVVVLVLLGGMAAAMVALSTSQQAGAAQDVLSARAWQAARAGNEWGLYQALQNNQCVASSALDLRAEMGFMVTVTCQTKTFNEGHAAAGGTQVVTFYEIRAVACPSASCPDASAVPGPDYVERTRVVRASR